MNKKESIVCLAIHTVVYITYHIIAYKYDI